VAERYFSPADVEALIPALSEIMQRVMPAHTEAETIRERMQGEQRRITMSGGGVIDASAWRGDRDRLEAAVQRVRQGLDEITRLGGAPKDLGLGLVDFLHLRRGHEVNLCWKYGEASIRFWHGLDEGYGGRKPL
jgi:hypothetical protein